MSIKGIENQIMVTRTAELSKDTSAQLKRGELSQQNFAENVKAAGEHAQKSVTRTEQSMGAQIHPDSESGDTYQPGGGGKRRERAPSDGELSVGSDEEHIIDIKV